MHVSRCHATDDQFLDGGRLEGGSDVGTGRRRMPTTVHIKTVPRLAIYSFTLPMRMDGAVAYEARGKACTRVRRTYVLLPGRVPLPPERYW